MVEIGDSVTVTIPTYWPGFLNIGFGDPTYALQQRLQQEGFEVTFTNAAALSYLLDYQRSNLIVAVIPRSSAYASVNDVASVVAGAAYDVGFDINAGATGQQTGWAHPQSGQPSTQQYQELQTREDADKDANKSVWDDIAKALGISTTTAQIGAVGLLALVAVVAIKAR